MSSDPRIDAYVAKAAPFAQPILRRYRKLVHEGCPGAGETLKWGFPHFMRGDALLCSMAAFKAHCAFGFWHRGMETVLEKHFGTTEGAMGHFGRVESIDDLPPERVILGFVRAAVKLTDSGQAARPRGKSKPKPEAAVPPELGAALRKNKTAAATFRGFSPSHRREYIEWISEAKREETREKRVRTTVEWLSKGKSLNWKYMDC